MHTRAVDSHPVDLLAAYRGIRALIADPDDTDQVFRIVRALSGRGFERLFRRVIADPDGRRTLEGDRPALCDVLADLDRLEAMPPGTLGHAYARFMRSEQLSAQGLVTASAAVGDTVFHDRRAEALSCRLRDMHDLWHVVSGYGRDLVGEGALLAFTYAQTRTRGIGFIALVGALRFWRLGKRDAAWALWHGYRRGRHAALLPAVHWEALLALPLAEVRRRLHVDDPPAYVPIRSAGAPVLPAGQ